MTAPTSRVSVIITCYNEGAYIGAAINSVLQQTQASAIDKIIINDDGSDADTIAVLKHLETLDPRILVLYGAGGAGLAAQRNAALMQSDAPLFAILDGDDLWAEEKLERQLPLLADLDVVLAYADYNVFPGEDVQAARRAGILDLSGARNLAHAYFLNDPPIIPSTTLIRRSAFDRCGGFDSSICVFEDTDFFLRLASVGSFAVSPAPLLYKRLHSASITGGRKDLMAHHAFVALKAAARDPSLLPLVNRRLAERARKLSNHYLLLDRTAEAHQIARYAIGLNPLNARAWASYAGSAPMAGPIRKALLGLLQKRRAALGVAASKIASLSPLKQN